MEIQQIAKRAAKKRNNRVAKELPLLAATGTIPQEYLTTPEQQEERILEQRKFAAICWDKIVEFDKELVRRAAAYREEVAKLVTAETLSQLDIEADKPWRKQPAYLADFWHCKLRELDRSR